MTSSDLRDYATVVTATVALLVFVLNSLSQVRNRRVANLARFIDAHQRLFSENGYIAKNIVAIESGQLIRDRTDKEMEARFHLMLLEIEQLAILANNGAVPRQTQVYMFGFYTQHVLAVITPEERKNMFWELALGYLDRLAKDTTKYRNLTHQERTKFWR
jgi:hypothetical protein